ncbi:UNVERIFIED_CONTAM: hypothetical protein Slati_0857100 [Sesamum latifolium]|uniref:Integrase catalytic domain-containing protein n=1 Tax=Sesamum latifolium TaxID=2727402 RepID=A0AAW2XLZ5_9LAMI
MKFIWKNIICRFGIPREIISDNDRQFQGRKIQEWCQGLRIKQRFTTVAHPQANGQVEVTNRILVQGIKRRLERVGGNWAEELTNVLWAYRTTPRGSTGETPFSLVYGTEAIIPAELGMPSHRFSSRRFGATKGRRPEAIGKLDPTWEGPYKVTSVIGKGAYELEDPEGRPCLDHGTCTISRNTLRNKIPLKDHQVTGAAPLLRSSEGPSIHRATPCSGPLKDRQFTGPSPCSGKAQELTD